MYRLGDTKHEAFVLTDFWVQVHHRNVLKGVLDLMILMDSLVIYIHYTKGLSFPSRISSVNVTKSAGNWKMENFIFCAVIHFSRSQLPVILKMTNVFYLIRETSAISPTSLLKQDLINSSNTFQVPFLCIFCSHEGIYYCNLDNNGHLYLWEYGKNLKWK